MSQGEKSERLAAGNVCLTGHIDVPEDLSAAVRAALPVHISLTRAEEGCISFNVVPCPTTPNRYLVSEVFVDQLAFDEHQKRTQASSWAKLTQGILRNYTIRVRD